MSVVSCQLSVNRFFLTPPIFAEAQFAFFALIFLGGQAGFSTAAMARSPELARLFQQPDLENHWVPMRNRALPSVMAFVAQATTRRVLCYATAKLLRDEAESMVPNIDPEQVRKLAGWGLTQNDRASFVGWSQSLISLGF